MNRVDDDALGAPDPEPRETMIRELARLRPAAPRPDLRERIAAELATTTPEDPRRRVSPPRRRGLGWLAERMLWAGGGAIAAAVPLLVQAPPAPAVGPAVGVVADAERVPDGPPGEPESPNPDIGSIAGVQTDPAGTSPESEPSDPIGPIAEESLAWSDDGVQFIDGQIPARVFRHWVLERFPSADGEGLVRPREDVFVVPVALR